MKLKDKNKERYNQIWKSSDVQNPKIWSTWKIIKEIIGKRNLEIGPGNYPKIPIQNGYFLDISETAVSNLKKIGAKAFLGSVEKIKFPNNFFDSVVALDVLEHIANDKRGFSEIARVLKSGGFFLFSVPLGRKRFSELDKVAGHKRRYEIKELKDLMARKGFQLLKWRRPSLQFYWLAIGRKLSLPWKIFLKIYAHKKSFRFFGLPKFLVNFLVRLIAFIDKISASTWEENKKALENFKKDWIILLYQKNTK